MRATRLSVSAPSALCGRAGQLGIPVLAACCSVAPGSAARYLRALAERAPAAARDPLEAAAAGYDHITAQLAPAVAADSPDHYRHWVGDMTRQRAHAALLRQVNAELLAVADAIDRALVVLDRSGGRVCRDATKVWIDGVEGFSPGEYASSPHGCQARILATVGDPLTYDDMVGYSGFAFRVGLHEALCPSAGHPCCGYQCMAGSDRALPWKVRLFESFAGGEPRKDRAAFEAEACAAIRDSIDRGVPVHYGSEEDGLIIGYADEGRRWLCVHPYHKGGREQFWYDEAKGFAGGKWPWGIVVWLEPKPAAERVPARELTIAALKQAVDMWHCESRDKYFCGATAYDRWLAWLRAVDAGTVADPKAGMQGNGWGFDVLIHSRRIAGRWLQRQADTFEGETAEHLRVAAGHYTQSAEALMAGLKCPWDLALPPARFADWTSALRQDQVRRLEAARDHDRAAIAAIAAALDDAR